MKVRTALLAMLLLDLAAGATWFAGRYGSGQPDALRLFLVWALPGLVFVCGLLTREPKRSARASSASALPGRLRLPGIPLPALPPALPTLPQAAVAAESADRSIAVAPVQPWSRWLPWIGIAVAVDLAPIGIGFGLGWLTLTGAAQTLVASRVTTALWALPLLMMILVRFYERTLRGQLFRGAEASWGAAPAWVLTVLAGTALALPGIAPGFSFSAPAFVTAALVTALAREIASVVLFRAAGLVAAGIFRGVLVFVDFYLIADGLAPLAPVVTGASYVASGDSFYLLRAASPLVAALLLARFLPAARARPEPQAAQPMQSSH